MGQEKQKNDIHTIPLDPDSRLAINISFIDTYNSEAYDIIKNLWNLHVKDHPFPIADPYNTNTHELRDVQDFVGSLSSRYFEERLQGASLKNIRLYDDGKRRGLALEYDMGYLDMVCLAVMDMVCGLNKIKHKKDIDVIWKIFIQIALFIRNMEETDSNLGHHIDMAEQMINEEPEEKGHKKLLKDLKEYEASYPNTQKEILRMLREIYFRKFRMVEIKKPSFYKNKDIAEVVELYWKWMELAPFFISSIGQMNHNGKTEGHRCPIEYLITSNRKSLAIDMLEQEMEHHFECYGGVCYNQQKILFEDGSVGKLDPGIPVESLQRLISKLRIYESDRTNTNLKRIERNIELGYKTLAAKKSNCTLLWILGK